MVSFESGKYKIIFHIICRHNIIYLDYYDDYKKNLLCNSNKTLLLRVIILKEMMCSLNFIMHSYKCNKCHYSYRNLDLFINKEERKNFTSDELIVCYFSSQMLVQMEANKHPFRVFWRDGVKIYKANKEEIH